MVHRKKLGVTVDLTVKGLVRGVEDARTIHFAQPSYSFSILL